KSTGDVSSEWSKQMNFAVQRFGRDFLQTLTGINQLADRSFTSIFSTLASGFLNSFSEVLTGSLTKSLGTSFTDMFKEGSNQAIPGISNALVAGAGLAGG